MTKEEFLNLSKKVLVNADSDVLEQLEKEYNFICKNLEHLRSINVDNVLPMSRISPTINHLRDDVVGPICEKEEVLSNASNHDNDYVIIKRTIK
ncbi:MAG: Asp-tRNA(Asn)/Glu-tRNA(Gln) amidotransferase subunit GatC [Metamycoplasmataceae bacterium]